MLSVDEAAIFDFMFQSNICPIFYIETLAAALNDFYARYADDPLIVDKWLTLQATVPEPIPSVGPVILFDKSFLEMLSVDEAAIFDFMFQSNICPIFYIETLAAALNDFYARYADDPLIVAPFSKTAKPLTNLRRSDGQAGCAIGRLDKQFSLS
jgi:hypothetical protein